MLNDLEGNELVRVRRRTAGMGNRDERKARTDFSERYAIPTGDVDARIEQAVIGAVWGVNGYTTVDQADELMARVRKGRIDVVGVYKLDRLGRSLQHLAQLISEFERHGTALVATSQGIDTSETNPAGRLQMHVLAAVAEFERSVIVERINAGLAAARERGTKLGRPPKLYKHRDAVDKLSRHGMSGRKVAAQLKIPAGSVFALLRDLKRAA